MSDHFGNIPIQPPQTPSERKKVQRKRTSTKKRKPIPLPTTKVPGANTFKWLIYLSIIATAYYGMGFFAVPYYLTRIVPSQLESHTGYTLHTSIVEFNPFTFKLKSGPIELVSEDNVTIVSYQSLIADIAPIPLLRFDLVCNSIELTKLDIKLVRYKDKSYNIEKLFPQSMGYADSDIMGFSDLPFFFSLNNIAIENSRIEFRDLPTGKEHLIEDIQLKLPTLSNIQFEADQYIHPYFSAVINGSPFELTGQTSAAYGFIDSGPTELSCAIKELNLKTYSTYLPFDLPFTIENGTADGTVELFFNPALGRGKKLAINFSLKLSDILLRNQDNSVAVKSADAKLKGTFQPISNNLTLNEIILYEPAIDTTGQSLLAGLKFPTNGASVETHKHNVNVNPFSFEIKSLTFLDGKVKLVRGKKKNFKKWENLQVQLKNFRNREFIEKFKAKSEGTFQLRLQKPGQSATFSYDGSFADKEFMAGDITMTKVPSNTVLKLILGNKAPQSEGIADLAGKLKLIKKPGSQVMQSRFIDTEITLNNFQLLSDKTVVLKSPQIHIQGFNSSPPTNHLGSVTLKKSLITLIDGKIPTPIPSFLSEKININSIQFQGDIALKPSKTNKPEVALSDFTLTATHLNNSKKTADNLSFHGTIAPKGVVKGTGSMTLHPFTAKIAGEFKNLNARNILYFYSGCSDVLPHGVIGGSLSGRGIFALPKKSFTGQMRIGNGWVQKNGKKDFSWNNLSMNNVNYASSPFHFGAEEIRIEEPNMQWAFSSTGLAPFYSLANTLKSYVPPEKDTNSRKNITISPIDVQTISITDGTIKIHDKRLSPQWSAEVTEVSGTVSGLHSAKTAPNGILSIKGKLDGSPFQVDGDINLFDTKRTSTIDFILPLYPLASFTKQLRDSTDLETSAGKLHLQSSLQIQGDVVNTSGRITLSEIKSQTPESKSTLTLAMLTGENNQISFDFSFSSEEKSNNSTFNEILSNYQRTLVKGEVSPLLLARKDFTDLVDVAEISFRPGEFILTEQGQKHVRRYHELLKTHPFVGLILSGGVNGHTDGKALKITLEKREKERVDQENKKLFAQYQARKNQYETQMAQRQEAQTKGQIVELSIPPEILTDFVPLQPAEIIVDDAMLLDLAFKRIKTLEQHFAPLNSLQFQRIFLDLPQKLPETNDKDSAGVQVHLKAVAR